MRRLLIFIPILLFTVIAQEKPIDNKADELQIKGYVIGQYTYYEADSAFANGITSPLHDAFAIRSARLVATGQLKHGFNYHIMAEFFPSGSADVQVMQAWVGYQFNQFARFRFGQFKYPFGYEAYKNNTTWSFANSSKVTGAVVKPLGAEGGKFRDIGLEVAGEYEFSGSLTGVYKLMVMNGSGPGKAESNNGKDIVAFIGGRLPFNIFTGISIYSGKSGSASDQNETALGVLFQYQTKRWHGQAEYIAAEYEASDVVTKPRGYYGFLTYRFLQPLEGGVRFDQYEYDSNAKNVLRYERWSLVAHYYFAKRTRISLNYEITDDDKNTLASDILTLQAQVFL
jgi:hypothetical protein